MQFRNGKVAQMKFQQKHCGYAVSVKTQPGVAGSQSYFVSLVWGAFGFAHLTSASWLDRKSQHESEIQDQLLEEAEKRTVAQGDFFGIVEAVGDNRETRFTALSLGPLCLT